MSVNQQRTILISAGRFTDVKPTSFTVLPETGTSMNIHCCAFFSQAALIEYALLWRLFLNNHWRVNPVCWPCHASDYSICRQHSQGFSSVTLLFHGSLLYWVCQRLLVCLHLDLSGLGRLPWMYHISPVPTRLTSPLHLTWLHTVACCLRCEFAWSNPVSHVARAHKRVVWSFLKDNKHKQDNSRLYL